MAQHDGKNGAVNPIVRKMLNGSKIVERTTQMINDTIQSNGADVGFAVLQDEPKAPPTGLSWHPFSNSDSAFDRLTSV